MALLSAHVGLQAVKAAERASTFKLSKNGSLVGIAHHAVSNLLICMYRGSKSC